MTPLNLDSAAGFSLGSGIAVRVRVQAWEFRFLEGMVESHVHFHPFHCLHHVPLSFRSQPKP